MVQAYAYYFSKIYIVCYRNCKKTQSSPFRFPVKTKILKIFQNHTRFRNYRGDSHK